MILYTVALLVLIYVISKTFLRSLRIPRIYDKYVFITGCDSGFGHLLAKRLDARGVNVFAGCLTEDGKAKLDKSTSCRVTPLLIDVTDEESIKEALMLVKSRLPYGRGLHGLVNNAGIYDAAVVILSEWCSIEDFEKLMNVNLYGMVRVTNRFLPLVRAERGRIVNMSSICGRLLASGGAPYVCSKFAVEGYSDTLRHEYHSAGVNVSIIEPSAYSTGIIDTDNMKKKVKDYFNRQDEDIKEYYGEDYPDLLMKRVLDKSLISGRFYQVVDAYEHALTAKYPKGRYVVGKDSNTILWMLYIAPEWLSAKILGFFQWPLPKGLSKL